MGLFCVPMLKCVMLGVLTGKKPVESYYDFLDDLNNNCAI